MSATRIVRLLLTGAATLIPALAQDYAISTYAGGVTPPGQAVSLAVDAAGNVYFSGSGATNVVFKLAPNGALTGIAGTLRTGFSGDGGPATLAPLHAPQGLAFDSAGNLYIVDAGNSRVRRVSPDGNMVTVAGGGTAGFGDGGPATSAQLNYPASIAVDGAGNLFIGEFGRVRKVTPDGIINTVAGGGSNDPGDGGPATSAYLYSASSVAVDSAGNLFIADPGQYNYDDCFADSRIRKVSPSGVITTLADSQNWTLGALAVDAAGDLFFVNGPQMFKISPSGAQTAVAGMPSFGFSGDGGPATQAQLNGPTAATVDAAGNLFIVDGAPYYQDQQRIRKISTDGTINTVPGGALGSTPIPSGDGAPATTVTLQLATPGIGIQSGLASDAAGNLYIAETGGHRVRKVSPSGVITTVAGVGKPRCSSSPAPCLPLGDGGPATSAALWYPTSVAVDRNGNVFIADYADVRVRKVTPDGIITTVAGNGTFGSGGDGGPATSAQVNASGIGVDGAGNLFIAEFPGAGLRKVSPDGIITTVAINGSSFGAEALAVDSSGTLVLSGSQCDSNFDNCHPAIEKVSETGVPGMITTPSAFPIAVAVDGAANVYYSDFNQSVNRISPDGTVTQLAGNGSTGYSGDGGLARNAALNAPFGLAVDGAGNVYIADGGNQAVRVLRPVSQSISAVVDAASQQGDAVSPGKIVVIYGIGLGPSQLVQNKPSNGVFGTQAGGTSVSLNGIAAPVLYASATQVAAIVPYAITGTEAQVTVAYQGQVAKAFTVPVAASAPNLFTLNQTGAGQAAAQNPDGTSNTAANPVKLGGIVSLYATGEGQTSPGGVDGMLAGTNAAQPVLPVSVTVGGIPAAVQYAGSAPGQVAGVMQVNVRIPSGVKPGGYVPVVVQVGDQTSASTVWIAVSGN